MCTPATARKSSWCSMQPVQVLTSVPWFVVVVHNCTGWLGIRRRNRASPDDDLSQFLR